MIRGGLRGPWPASGRGATRRIRRARAEEAPVPAARARKARLVLLAVVVGAGLLALGARCAHLQVLRGPSLLDQARSQQEKTITLDPHRGPLLDRNGKELALSLDVDSIFADPTEVGDPAAASRRLAPILGMKPAEVRARLDADRHFVWLKRKVTPDLRRQVEGLGLEGIGFVRESRRYYPKQGLAAHVLGTCGVDNQGLAGLEFAYDRAIQGTPGRILVLCDGRGGRVLDRARVEAATGAGLVLTIDEVIQHVTERELDAAMLGFAPAGASVVVLRPRTGEVLALASRPTFDPNNFTAAREEARRNRAVTDYYEPGSTFKVITASAALDAGRVHPNEVIWCENGSIVVGRHRFREDRLPYGNLTFTEVLAKSSNVGAIKVAARLRPREFIDYIRAFGFGRKTGIELPGESAGMLRDLPDWSGLSQASIAMGQEVGATPLQLAAAVGALANDGVYVPPRIVGATITADGRRVPARSEDDPARPEGEPAPRRVISEATARTLRRMLESVTIEGTGKGAAVPGYTVGGKTGTAQKIDASGHYSHGKYVSWFGGFVPADSPALAIVVMVDEPKGPKFHGGDVAAPIFARIALPVLQYLGVAPDREGPLVFDTSVRASLGSDDAGRLDGGRDAGQALPAVRRVAVAPGRGRPGARHAARPPAGLSLADPSGLAAASIAAFPPRAPARAAEAAPEAREPGGAGDDPAPAMPDLSGMSLRQASETLAAAGLACTTLRSGPRVTRQDPDPGAPVAPAGTGRCIVIF